MITAAEMLLEFPMRISYLTALRGKKNHYSVNALPSYDRLNGTREDGWCAELNDGEKWLQVDLEKVTKVYAVATQGDINGNEWVIYFKPAHFKSYEDLWPTYKGAKGLEVIFHRDGGSYTIDQHALEVLVFARYLRFLPVTWQRSICRRVEVYGTINCTSESRMMHVPLVLLVLGLCTFKETCEATCAEISPLGRVIDLRKVNLLADFQEQENGIFEELSTKCLVKKTLKSSSSHFEYYANTKEFYKSLATQSGLSASLQSSYSLGVTVAVATKSKSSQQSEVSGMSLIKQALTEKIHVDKECLLSDDISTLKRTFLNDLEDLPVNIKNPWEPNSWREYRNFLRKYGSHAITSVKRGSRFQQMTFAESSKTYTERDFQVKACVSVAGPTQVGKVGVSACSNVSQSEISKASRMSTSEKRFVKGGKRETNSKLANGATSVDLLDQLMNEADEFPASVQHTFMAIWTILQSRFKQGSPNNIRATNLEYYYLGFLNYGCPYISSSGLAIQKFDHTSSSNKEYPEFECTLAKEGCHNSDDCHYRPIWCSCRGPTCVHYKKVKEGAGDSKLTAYPNTFEDWAWQGCGWKVAGSWCECYNKNRGQRKTVWSLPNRDAPTHKASTKTAAKKAED